MWRKIVHSYLGVSLVFGAVHKLSITWNAKLDKRPMLLGEKIGVISLGIALSPLLAPTWCLFTLDEVDMYMRGKTPEDYGIRKKEYMIDYILL